MGARERRVENWRIEYWCENNQNQIRGAVDHPRAKNQFIHFYLSIYSFFDGTLEINKIKTPTKV